MISNSVGSLVSFERFAVQFAVSIVIKVGRIDMAWQGILGKTKQMGIQLEETAELIVKLLELEISPAEIKPDELLFGDGLGLDSIDGLEIAMELSERYNIDAETESEENPEIFATLRTMTDYINRKIK